MCTNALNCTYAPLIDGAELLRSTGQILQWVKHGLSDRLNSLEHRGSWILDILFVFTHLLSCKCSVSIQVKVRSCVLNPPTFFSMVHISVIVWDFPWHCYLSRWLSLEADVSVPLLCSIRERPIAKGCLALAPTDERKVKACSANLTTRPGQPHPGWL